MRLHPKRIVITIYLLFIRPSSSYISIFRRQELSRLHAYAYTATAECGLSRDHHEIIYQVLNTSGSIDLTSPRAWLEYLESERGSAGVYTVMRIDSLIHMNSTSSVPCYKHTIWGEDFHFRRLCSSFGPEMGPELIRDAKICSSMIVSSLIRFMQESLRKTEIDEIIENRVNTFMVTLLWTSSPNLKTNPVIVSGHICSVSTVVDEPSSIKAAMALPFEDSVYRTDDKLLSWRNLPNRVNNHPQVKFSSWCRQRRPLENIFKRSDIGEVLLVRPLQKQNWEILEGLTSNLFVVYNDGTLRTCTDGVLNGYAKSLVEEAAVRCNITISHFPISLQDAFDGYWKEVFLTSSIRIIIPVKEIVIPDHDTSQDIEFIRMWTSDSSSNSCTIWKTIFSEILRGRSLIRPVPSFEG